jgi:hypothetical protein
MVRFIPTRVHGVIDYLAAGLLIGAPVLLGFKRKDARTWIPIALGIGTIAYSALTDYEIGVVRIIPMPVHLKLDAANGALLAASPWLFGFADEVAAPHLMFGLFEIGASLVTQPVAGDRPETNTATSM